MDFREWLFNESVNDSTILVAAKNIVDMLNGNKVYRGQIANMLYHAFTNRNDDQTNQQNYSAIKHLDQKYRDAIAKLDNYFSTNGFKVSYNGPWVQIDTFGSRKTRTMGDFKESAKVYWSVEVNEGNIKNYLNSIIHLAHKLRLVSQENSDGISFKFPSTLIMLNRHVDSLVVYMGNPRNRDVVEQSVEETLNQGGVKIQDRSLRAKRGFDWKKDGDFSMLDPADKRGGSHTELIAHVIATNIASNSAAFRGKSVQEIAQFIKTWAKSLSKYSPSQMYQQFYGKPAPTRIDPYAGQETS